MWFELGVKAIKVGGSQVGKSAQRSGNLLGWEWRPSRCVSVMLLWSYVLCYMFCFWALCCRTGSSCNVDVIWGPPESPKSILHNIHYLERLLVNTFFSWIVSISCQPHLLCNLIYHFSSLQTQYKCKWKHDFLEDEIWN